MTHVDVTERAALERSLRGCDAVVHLAGIDLGVTGDTRMTADLSERIMRTNALGTWNVLTACQRLAIGKLVLASSEAALGLEFLDRDGPPPYLPIDEAHPLRPSDTYG